MWYKLKAEENHLHRLKTKLKKILKDNQSFWNWNFAVAINVVVHRNSLELEKCCTFLLCSRQLSSK